MSNCALKSEIRHGHGRSIKSYHKVRDGARKKKLFVIDSYECRLCN
jgi:hypothetical protein